MIISLLTFIETYYVLGPMVIHVIDVYYTHYTDEETGLGESLVQSHRWGKGP